MPWTPACRFFRFILPASSRGRTISANSDATIEPTNASANIGAPCLHRMRCSKSTTKTSSTISKRKRGASSRSAASTGTRRASSSIKRKRQVRTASATQVRRPIYRTSVNRARDYGDLLKPLLDALNEKTPAASRRGPTAGVAGFEPTNGGFKARCRAPKCFALRGPPLFNSTPRYALRAPSGRAAGVPVYARFSFSGVAGFEPTNGGFKARCLTAWRHPSGGEPDYGFCERVPVTRATHGMSNKSPCAARRL